jgi:hypothetical protein
MGDLLGALAIDNLSLADPINSTYTVQSPSAVVTDLTGDTGKNYGMRFNNYLSIADHSAQYDKLSGASTLSGLSYYMTTPLLYTVTDPTQTLVFNLTSSDTANYAVSVVQIK